MAVDAPEPSQFVKRLHDAAASGDATTIQALIKAGVKVNVKDARGWTALMLAARNGHSDATSVLLDGGCDRSLLNSSGQTALDIARFWNHQPVTDLLQDVRDCPYPMEATVNFFSGGNLDRCADKRKNDTWLAQKIQDVSSRFVIFIDLKPLVRTINPKDGPSSVALQIFTIKEVSPVIDNAKTTVFLGTERLVSDCDVSWFAINIGDMENQEIQQLFPGTKTIESLPGSLQLDRKDATVFAHARSLLAWHDRHQFCPTCGSSTTCDEGGYKRTCTSDTCRSRKGVHNTCYPRLDPTVIMAVISHDRKRLLLGRGANFPRGMYSCLAGFMEPGESVEETCRREVQEESGVAVGQVEYHSSQPWPMPATLMIGCLAHATSDDIQIDKEELEDARWFSRVDVLKMLHGNHPEGLFVPPEQAIAHVLIRAWVNTASNL